MAKSLSSPNPQKSKGETCTSYIQVFNANDSPMNGTWNTYLYNVYDKLFLYLL